MRELVYLITTEGDFEGANSKPIQERGPFLEMDLRLPGDFLSYMHLSIKMTVVVVPLKVSETKAMQSGCFTCHSQLLWSLLHYPLH